MTQGTSVSISGTGILHHSDESRRVMRALEIECDRLLPGDRLPTHTDLMRQMNASERTVLKALHALTASGRLIRRTGAGTFVAERAPARNDGVAKASVGNVVVVAWHDNGYFSSAIDTAFRQAADRSLRSSFELPEIDRLLAIEPSDATAFLLIGSTKFDLATRLLRQGRCVLVVGDPGFRSGAVVPSVHSDNIMGGYIAARHLIDCGYRRIAYLAQNNDPQDNPRYWGFNQAARHSQADGRKVDASVVTLDQFESWVKDPDLALAYIHGDAAPVGFCAWNDTECIRTLTFLQSIGIRIPDQVGLVGYDNLHESTRVTPALTTIEPKLEHQISLALERLANSPASAPEHRTIVTPALVIRASTTNLQQMASA